MGSLSLAKGRQPVEDIWLIHPARQYRSRGVFLTLDIAKLWALTTWLNML